MSASTHGGTPYYYVPAESRHPVLAAAGLFFVILGAAQWINDHATARTVRNRDPLRRTTDSDGLTGLTTPPSRGAGKLPPWTRVRAVFFRPPRRRYRTA